MPLTSGTRLGPYEIVSAIGAGGMGEVYKARDTRLDRVVALKVIQTQVAATPEFRERFDREARAISALDHPHICTLYDVGHDAGADYLVMQHLDGETLADRLARAGKPRSGPSRPASGGADTAPVTVSRGPIPLETTLRYAAQIAAALDAAHRRGIVHRDLKPGNIMITKTGTKLLDFGLAKLAAEEAGTSGFGEGATRSSPLTGQGAILGTLYYMSPEQLEGRAVDARSDIFSFGAVLYEMLTGRRAFESDSQAGTIAAIIAGDPPPLGHPSELETALPIVAHRALDRLLRKCLTKNPDDRWHSAADLSDELNWVNEERLRGAAEPIGAPSAAPVGSQRRERLWMAAAAVMLIALVGLGVWWYPRPAPPAAPVAFTIEAPHGQLLATGPGFLAVSPDGRRLAFATGEGEGLQLWIRSLDSLDVTRVERAVEPWHPFWSPNGQFIAHAGPAGRALLRRLDLAGGPPLALGGEIAGRGSWGSSGVILFPGIDGKLYSVAETGGEPKLVMELDSAGGEVRLDWPLFLPDGRRYVFSARHDDRTRSALYLASLDSPGRTRLVDVLSNVDYADGHLFYQRDGTLTAHPFDIESGRLTGEAIPLIERIQINASNGRGAFSVSPAGVLAYRARQVDDDAERRRIMLFDPAGKPLAAVGPPGPYIDLALSPNGRQVAVVEENRQDFNATIYLLDIDRGVRTRFTIGDNEELAPLWSPDGASIVFASTRNNRRGLYRRLAGGAATTDELLFDTAEQVNPTGFSPDGATLLFTRGSFPSQSVWALPLTGDRKPVAVFPGSTTSDAGAVFSPDGKWIAYNSVEAPGRLTGGQIHVQPFPADGRRIQISTASGYTPAWSGVSQIVYRTYDGVLESVVVSASDGTLVPGRPAQLFAAPKVSMFNWTWDRTSRADRFIMIVPPAPQQETGPAPITVIVNWTSTLPRK